MAKRKSRVRRSTADEQTVLRDMHVNLLAAPTFGGVAKGYEDFLEVG